MYTYDLLETGCYYLVRETEEAPVRLIRVAMETDLCLFIIRYDDPGATEWKLKKDRILDIIECLSDEKVKEWEEQFKSSGEAYYDSEED
ncbi:MAG: hypothetical protein RJA57_1129 [Bacteroidota bacterium]|jgi:hypothetical protein